MKIHEKVRSSRIKTKRPTQIKAKLHPIYREASHSVRAIIRRVGNSTGMAQNVATEQDSTDNSAHSAYIGQLQRASPYLNMRARHAAWTATKKSGKGLAGQTQQMLKIKDAFSAVKTAAQPVKTGRYTVRSAGKGKAARRSINTFKRGRVTPKTKKTAAAAKGAAKGFAGAIKGVVLAMKSLVTVLFAGGWLVLLIVLAAGLIAALIASVFGIFFGNASDETALQLSTAMSTVTGEYSDSIQALANGEPYDRTLITINGRPGADISDTWKQVLAVYAVRAASGNGAPIDFSDPEKIQLLRSTFFDMVSVTGGVETVEDEVPNEDGQTAVITTKTLKAAVTAKNAVDMQQFYGFSAEQRRMLSELLDPGMNDVWRQLLYGNAGIGNGDIVQTAISQLGNTGGQPYWSWYGFSDRVEWCACFVSWCAEQNGFLSAGIMPKFANCDTGIAWFKDRKFWRDKGYEPQPGDIIFFDWNFDGISDHVGIVEYTRYGVVHTIEGNSGDTCTRMTYAANSNVIQGYGTPAYPLSD